ncbi:MurR/RpiR family transcriptional regulator [Enterococcus lactis]|uniref:MurR/RpiR family transcriptional regulator n=1 Tax=Enterococcus lactis TaxID=357441 RepID=UPI0038491CC5
MLSNSLIALLEKKRSSLSKIENEILDYIFLHLSVIGTKTIYEVSDDLFVSTATISRTAKHLGYQGFKELKYAIDQSIHVEEQEGNSRSFQTITNQITSNVTETFHQMSEEKAKQMMTLIHQSNTIEVFGLGGSFPICTDFARKLTFLGKKAFARSDWDEQEAAVSNLNQEDLAIFVSFTGETKGILSYAQIAQRQQVPIISIISTKGSNLEKLSTISLYAKGTTRYHHSVDLSSRISVICLFDTVLLMYADQMKNN